MEVGTDTVARDLQTLTPQEGGIRMTPLAQVRKKDKNE